MVPNNQIPLGGDFYPEGTVVHVVHTSEEIAASVERCRNAIAEAQAFAERAKVVVVVESEPARDAARMAAMTAAVAAMAAVPTGHLHFMGNGYQPRSKGPGGHRKFPVPGRKGR